MKRGPQKGNLSFKREMLEYIALWAELGEPPSFIPQIHGMPTTDLGLGLACEAIRDAGGNLCPNLLKLKEQDEFTQKVLDALRVFKSQLIDSALVISDVHPANLVYQEHYEKNGRIVMIDGFGCANLIPVKTFVKSLNRRSKEKKFGRLLEQLGIEL